MAGGGYDPNGNWDPYLSGGGYAPPPVLNSPRYAKNPFDINSANAQERQRAQQYRDSVDKAGLEQAGQPDKPNFNPISDENGNIIKSGYKLDPLNINTSALDAIRSQALGTGPSPWLSLQLQKQEADQNTAQGQAGAQNNANAATARSSLAMKGGLSSGAAERLAKTQMSGGNAAYQNVANTGNQNRLNLQIQDQTNRQQLLSQLPQTELQYAQANQDTNKFNVQNSLNDLLANRANDVNFYNQGMKAWAAGKTADAQGGGGKK